MLGAGVEPAHLAAPEPKSGVSAIPPPERNLCDEVCASDGGGKRLHEAADGRTDLGVDFHGGLAGVDEVVFQFDPSGFEDRGDERSAETEVAFLVALRDGLAGLIRLDDGADVRGADGDHGDESEGAGVDRHSLTLVLPEIRGAAAQGDRIDGVELTFGEHGLTGHAGDREVEAVIIDGAEA